MDRRVAPAADEYERSRREPRALRRDAPDSTGPGAIAGVRDMSQVDLETAVRAAVLPAPPYTLLLNDEEEEEDFGDDAEEDDDFDDDDLDEELDDDEEIDEDDDED
jgi:hypothetical protein